MGGERDLGRLLAGMRPRLRPGVWLFCRVAKPSPDDLAAALGTFREDEGVTLVLAEEEARSRGFRGEFRAAWISLEIHSDFAAIGFLARIANALAAAGLPANTISAVHHDHLFVPYDERERALATLEALTAEARG